MMTKRQRTLVVATSDSSEDDVPHPNKQLRSSPTQNTQSTDNLFMDRLLRRQEDHGVSSDSSFVISPKKQRKKLPISTSEDSLSSESDEIIHPVRHGSMKALSDYESNDSTDRAHGSPWKTVAPQRHKRDPTQSVLANTVQSGEVSESFSDDSIIRTRSGGCHKRQLNPLSTGTSDSSDSGIPIHFTRTIKRNRLPTSSEEGDSSSSFDSSSNRRVTRSTRIVEDNNRPTTSRNSRLRQRRRRLRSSFNSTEPRLYRASLRNNTITGRRIPVVQREDEFSSDSDIRPRNLRHRRIPIFASDSTTSSSGSDENFPIQNHRRLRGALVALHESEEDDGKPNVSSKTLIPNKSSLGHSSDSDGESEKCPICFARFTLQEVSTPSSCDHSFCTVCIQEWAKNNNSCPIDRQLFNSIMVRAHVQGEIIREIPIEPPPVRILWESEEWWENIAADIIFANQEISSSISEYDSDGDGPDEMCCICCLSNHSDAMIVCDLCNSVYHMNCLNPPLRDVPVSDWYCPACEAGMLTGQ